MRIQMKHRLEKRP